MKLKKITNSASDILTNGQSIRLREHEGSAEFEFQSDENPLAIIEANKTVFVRSFSSLDEALAFKAIADTREGVYAHLKIRYYGI